MSGLKYVVFVEETFFGGASSSIAKFATKNEAEEYIERVKASHGDNAKIEVEEHEVQS